jgi:arylsulfatase A
MENNRMFLRILTGALLCAAHLAQAESHPNVVIFFTDDQGTLDANCYGSKDLYTPTIDHLAETGVRFTQAYAHTVCCPARALLLTGRHPQRSGITNWTQGSRNLDEGNPGGTNLPKGEVTLAEALKPAGYKTGIVGKWHLGAREGHGPLDQGFDRFYGHLGGFIDNYRHHFLHGDGFHDLYDQKKEIDETGKYFPDLATKHAVEFIEQNKEGPFFLYVAFNIPHYPEQADAKFDDRYADLPMPRQSYAKMVSTTDDRMGVIVKKITDLGLRDNTMIIYMSDNGHSAEDGAKIRGKKHSSGLEEGTYYHAHGGGGNTGVWKGHKGNYFEGGLRVPAIISYPKLLPKKEIREQAVTAADWFPTILELCGVDKPDGLVLDGKSLLPILKDPKQPSHHDTLHWAWENGWAVRMGPWKLIGNGGEPRQLVNLEEDQPERVNHLKDQQDLAKRLKILHLNWLTEVIRN